MKNFTKASVLLVFLIALVVALSGCTTPTATPAANATPTAVANVTATPAATSGLFQHTATINNVTYTFNTHKKDTLTIPSDASYPPFESLNATTNKIEGFDIDLMNEISKELNVTPEYSNMVFDSLITDIQTGKDDLSISAFTITPERQKAVDFSDQYYENKGQAIMVKVNSSIKGPSDLVGKKVGAEKGTVGYYAVLNITGVNPADVHGYETMPDSFMALQKGDVEVVAGDYAVMYPFVKKHSAEYTFAPTYMSETEYFGIVISKDNPQLTAAVNAALKDIKSDGRYQQIYDRWFGE